MNNDFHRLLKRQLKECFGDKENIPEQLDNFLELINDSYKSYDKDLEQLEHILKLSSQELFKANKELNFINNDNEKVIEQKTNSLSKTTFILENAEKIAGLSTLSFNFSTKTIEFSSEFANTFSAYLNTEPFDLQSFFKNFNNSDQIYGVVQDCIRLQRKQKINLVSLVSDTRFFEIECDILKDKQNLDENILIIVFKDVTSKHSIERDRETLLYTLKNYSDAINYAAIVSITDKNGVIIQANEAFCEISQYSQNELIGKNHKILNSGFHDANFYKDMWGTISSGKIWKGIFRNKKKDGTYYWVDSTIVPFQENGKIFQYISIRYDITEKIVASQRIEQQKEFYENILNTIPVDIAVFNKNHEYLFVNENGIKSKEIRDYIIGKTDFDYCKKFNRDITLANFRHNLFNEAIEKRDFVEFTDTIKKPDDSMIYVVRRFFPVFDSNGEFNTMLGYGVDITEKAEQAKVLEESLKEKETLLSEIHHRVKNNLALVVGLIEMQIFRNEDENFKLQLNEILRRISAIALIHEKLYKSNNFSMIEMPGYIKEFVGFTSHLHDKTNPVILNYDFDEVYLTTKQAIPLALAINELITNTYKYAFKDNLSPRLNISLKKESDDDITLIFSDNGKGLPPELDITKSKSLGFKLILIFIKQLKGTYTISNEKGFSINVKFKYSEIN